MNFWRVAADAVVLAHAAYVGFVGLGVAAILIGAAAGWRWVRNFYFRAAHLAAIALVLAEALLGEICPLTAWENRLRERAGQAGYPGDFIAYWVHWLIFYDWPPWVFTALYAGFTIAVIAAFWLAPPRLPWREGRAELRGPEHSA
jgi:Protein of Unknown function (DUF2784)